MLLHMKPLVQLSLPKADVDTRKAISAKLEVVGLMVYSTSHCKSILFRVSREIMSMERNQFVIDNPTGPELKEIRLRYKLNCESCHYSSYLLSGPQLLSYVADAVTDFTIRRDDGDGSMLVNINANFVNSIYGGDTIEVITYLEKEGTRSRIYGYAVYKIVHFIQEEKKFKVLDEPTLISAGNCTVVVKKART